MMTANIRLDLEQLLAGARTGDAGALGELLERYRTYLSLLARIQINQRLQGKLDASDLVQDAFFGAARDIASFRGTGEKEFVAWLRQILTHVLANSARHYTGTKQRDVRLERRLATEIERSSVALDGALISRESSPSQQAAKMEMGVILANALERLPPEEKEVLILRHFEGLTFPDVAARMNRTLDVVKKMWPKALAHLRRTIKEFCHESESRPLV